MNIKTASISKAGGRMNNEDYCSFFEKDGLYLWVVADGMGGHYGGEVASKKAVETIMARFNQYQNVNQDIIFRLLSETNQEILTTQNEKAVLKRMQTTIVLLAADTVQTICAHLGDSRAYHFHQGKLITRTQDHSVVQALVNQGEISEKEMRFHEDRNKVLRTLGKDDQLNPSIQNVKRPIQAGDAWLLCTDGFWEYVWEYEMEIDYFKSRTPKEWLTKMEARLLARVSANHDNYTAVAIFCRE